jgi:hypothetical protein
LKNILKLKCSKIEFSGQDKLKKAVSLKAVNSKLDSLRALGNLLEGRNILKFDG